MLVIVCSCLNPYYNGRYSPRCSAYHVNDLIEVLILIIMEDTLRVECMEASGHRSLQVLILIIMEDTLRVHEEWYYYVHS